MDGERKLQELRERRVQLLDERSVNHAQNKGSPGYLEEVARIFKELKSVSMQIRELSQQ